MLAAHLRTVAQFLGEHNFSFDGHERIRGSIILDAQSGKVCTGEISTLHGVFACVEDDVPVVVGDEPDRSDV